MDQGGVPTPRVTHRTMLLFYLLSTYSSWQQGQTERVRRKSSEVGEMASFSSDSQGNSI